MDKLRKTIGKIEGVTQSDIDNLCHVFEQCKPEIDEILKLSNFATKGKLQVSINYEVDVDFNLNLYEVWAKQDIEEGCLFNGRCYTDVKQPAGYNIAQFISDKHFGNMGIDNYDDASEVHPEIKKHVSAFIKSQTALIKKLENVMDNMGLDAEFKDWAMDFIDNYLQGDNT